ncbi:LysR substrate-binding domain-containing protein [Pseudoalteromonas sp. SSM20]|uniref:LysR substrate-binding domain-containing protein n=1 Tax=Pseudoalteromonas sp. SSM20 TaxID=3139394 RepID=UPI003BA92A38
MRSKYPPLHLLSIFEAAARHQNFKSASNELCITPSAVSHQIKALEEQLGFSLFQRKSRGVVLNNAGEMYLNFVQQGLECFEQGTRKVRNRFSSQSLKISCFTTMASHIIIPKLGAFQAMHPEIELRIETGNHVSDLRFDDIDLAIRIGQGNWPNTINQKLLDLTISAVCSKSFLNKYQVKAPDDVNALPLIDLSYMDDVWSQWSKATGTLLTQTKRSLTFSDYDSSINAASQGLGLALGIFPIENSKINNNTLTTPFNEFVPFKRDLYAVYREEDANRHDIRCFINWLVSSPELYT